MLKMSVDAETRKAYIYEKEVLRLKLVNEQLQHTHELTMLNLTNLGSQVHEVELTMLKLTNLGSQVHEAN